MVGGGGDVINQSVLYGGYVIYRGDTQKKAAGRLTIGPGLGGALSLLWDDDVNKSPSRILF